MKRTLNKELEIQKLQLENQRIILEKDSAFEKYKSQIEKEFKELKEAYTKEKFEMKHKIDQVNIQAKAFQMLSANETYLSPRRAPGSELKRHAGSIERRLDSFGHKIK